MSVTLGMILEARERLKGVAQRTGLVQFKALSDEQSQIYLKTEDLQNTGSFKVRGAYIKIASLSEEERVLAGANRLEHPRYLRRDKVEDRLGEPARLLLIPIAFQQRLQVVNGWKRIEQLARHAS